MSKPQLNIVLVDDEEPARQRLRQMLDELEGFTFLITAEATNGKEALKLIPQYKSDLIFLDIQMPELDGFDVAGMLPEPRPPIIFATAFDEYALQAFEVHAVDYLLKPIRKKRLHQAVQRVIDQRELQQGAVDKMLSTHTPATDRIGVHYKQEILLINTEDILWFEAHDKLVHAITEERSYRVDVNLDQLEQRHHATFLRCHRSYLVNTGHIRKLIPWFNQGWRIEVKNGRQLEVARRRVAELKSRLGIS